MTIRWWPCYSKSGESEGFYFAFKQEYSHHGVQITEIWKLAKSQFISMSQFRKAFSNISLWYWNSKMSLVNIRSKMIRKLLSWMCSFVSFALYFFVFFDRSILILWNDTIQLMLEKYHEGVRVRFYKLYSKISIFWPVKTRQSVMFPLSRLHFGEPVVIHEGTATNVWQKQLIKFRLISVLCSVM